MNTLEKVGLTVYQKMLSLTLMPPVQDEPPPTPPPLPVGISDRLVSLALFIGGILLVGVLGLLVVFWLFKVIRKMGGNVVELYDNDAPAQEILRAAGLGLMVVLLIILIPGIAVYFLYEFGESSGISKTALDTLMWILGMQ